MATAWPGPFSSICLLSVNPAPRGRGSSPVEARPAEGSSGCSWLRELSAGTAHPLRAFEFAHSRVRPAWRAVDLPLSGLWLLSRVPDHPRTHSLSTTLQVPAMNFIFFWKAVKGTSSASELRRNQAREQERQGHRGPGREVQASQASLGQVLNPQGAGAQLPCG